MGTMINDMKHSTKCPACNGTDVYSSDGQHSCRFCAFGWNDRRGPDPARIERARAVIAAEFVRNQRIALLTRRADRLIKAVSA